MFQFLGGLERCLEGLSPQKPPVATGLLQRNSNPAHPPLISLHNLLTATACLTWTVTYTDQVCTRCIVVKTEIRHAHKLVSEWGSTEKSLLFRFKSTKQENLSSSL